MGEGGTVLNLGDAGFATTLPLVYRPYSAITRFSESPPDNWSIFGPFEPKLWGIIVAFMIGMGTVAALIEAWHDEDTTEFTPRTALTWAYDGFYFSLSTLLGGGSFADGQGPT